MKELEAFEAWWSAQETGLGTAHKFTAWNAWIARAAVEADRAQIVPDAAAERERILGMLTRHDWQPTNIFRTYYPSVTGDWVDLRELRTLLASTPAPAQQERKPMTEDALVDGFCWARHSNKFVSVFIAGARFAERHHGIRE